MAFTGSIGSSDSRLGNIVLGLGASQARIFRRNSRSPVYRLQVFDFADTTTFGVGDLLADFARFKNVGWADFANGVPQMFATLMQDDPQLVGLRGKAGKLHYRLWRNDSIVQVGWAGLEYDANSRDVILYGYGYLAGMFWEVTTWEQEWTNATVGEIVSDGFDRVHDTTNSRFAFITKGTIEEPETTLGGGTPITLPLYNAFYKRILFLMQELAAISASDTGQTTIFEITPSTSPTFNFWKNRSSTVNLGWRWDGGKGKIADFRELGMPVYHRNNALGVGATPRDLILRQSVEDATDQTTDGWGRMTEPLFFAWVRDEDEMDRVLRLRAEKGKRDQPDLQLIFHAGAEVPPGCTDSQWRLGDKVPVKIDRGITNINATYQIVGHMTLVADGNEFVRAMIQEPV